MKKRTIKIAILLVAVIALIFAYVALTNLDSESESSETTAASSSYTVAKIDLNTIYQFGYTYNGNKFVFRLNDDSNAWLWDDNTSLPISNTKIALMLTHFSEMTSTILLDELSEEKLIEYGLTSPTLDIYFKDANGLHSYKLGIVNPYNSLIYIMSEKDTSKAYMVSSELLGDFEDSIDNMLSIEENLSLSSNENASVTVECGTDRLIYNYYPNGKASHISSSNKWFLSVNGADEFPINEELGNDLTAALKSNIFAQTLTYDKNDYEKYGLSEKRTKVILTGTNITSTTDSSTGETTSTKTPVEFAFYLGGVDEDGYSYGMTDNSPLVYLTTSSVLAELYSFDKNNIASIYSAHVWNTDQAAITEVSFVYKQNSFILTLKETSSGVVCSLNGKSVSHEAAKGLLESISTITWDNDISKAEEGSAEKASVITISITANEVTASAEILTYSDEYHRITFDGHNEFLILPSKVSKIISELEKLA